MYKIGELSKLCNISVKALRYYDAQGLLIPDQIDKFTGYRYYSTAKLYDCYRIIAFKELGFSLDEIKTQLITDNKEQMTATLNTKIDELSKQIKNAEEQLRRIERIRNNFEKREHKMFNIIIRATDEIRVALTRKIFLHKSDALTEISEMNRALPKTILGKRKIIINYEIEYREKEFDLSACIEIVGKLPQNANYTEKTITFGDNVASLICSIDELDDAYKAMITHLNESNYAACGAYYEIYHDDNTVELKIPVCERTRDQTEDVALPFADDPAVCGKWEMIDILPTREHFLYGKPKCSHPAWLHELYFIDGGKPYWCVGGWTKGFLFTYGSNRETLQKHRYTIEDDGKHKLLFLEMNHCNVNSAGFGTPEIWVYEKTEERHYSSKEDFRKCDRIDYPFAPDESVLGIWKVKDLVINKNNFDPERQNFREQDLYLQQVEFKDHGEYVTTTKNGTNSVTSTWTKGLILNKREKTASAYEIKVINGKEYLFREWKSGDYSFGNRKACWYIFTRG